MNISDRLESGFDNTLSPEAVTQIPTHQVDIRRQGNYSAVNKLLKGARSYSGKPLNIDDRVASVVEQYIANHDYDHNREWTNYIRRELQLFNNLLVKHQYDLEMTVVEYHVDEPQAFEKRYEIHDFDGLLGFLEKTSEETLRAQLTFFTYDTELLSRSLGFRRRSPIISSRDKNLDSTSAIAITLLGARWNINPACLQGLVELDKMPRVEPDWTKIRLPSAVDLPITYNCEVKRLSIVSGTPLYVSDAVMYAVRPHCREPPTESINTIYVAPTLDPKNRHWKAVISSSNLSTMNRLLHEFSDKKITLQVPEVQRRIKDPSYALHYIQKQYLEYTCNVLMSLSQNIDKHQFKGRHSPSYGRLDYLLHIIDHLSYIEKMIEPLTEKPLNWPVTTSVDYLDAIKKDKEYILEKVGEIRQNAINTRKLIEEQLEAHFNYRSTILTVLAAIYVPLSFTTGLFGMNVREINGASPPLWNSFSVGGGLVLVTMIIPLVLGTMSRYTLSLTRSNFLQLLLLIVLVSFAIGFYILPEAALSQHLPIVPYGVLLAYTAYQLILYARKKHTTEIIFYTSFSFLILSVTLLSQVIVVPLALLPFPPVLLPLLWFWEYRERFWEWRVRRRHH